ncbi:hypothetical protein DL771_003678 [Monosporascus sp. 5C6A]|nr:hypothetical protein DL771_003678 [Monosporascus sp. 5C6A]
MSISTVTYCGIQATLGVLVATFVTIRLRSNYVLTGKLAADDYLSPIAILFWAGYSATSIMNRFMSSPVPVLVAMRVATANAHLSGAVRYFSKAPLLVLYIRIFGIKKWVRVTPSRTISDEALQLYCFKGTYALMIIRGLTSVLTDVVMLCLPLAVISKLQLSPSKKIGIALVFMSGIFGIAAASLSLSFSWNFLNTPSDKTNAALLIICIVFTPEVGLRYDD